MSKAALAKVTEAGSLVTIHSPEEIAETAAAVAEATGSRGMTPQDLPRVGLPAGKAKQFLLDEGETMAAELVGAVLLDQDVRLMFDKPFGQGEKLPPVCTSSNGIVGVGSPGGDCETCPNNQWGSKLDENGNPTRGKRCAERRLFALFCVQPESTLPLILSAPPSSLNSVRKDFMRACSKGRVSNSLWTFYLETKNSNGYDHPVVRARFERKLTDKEIDLVAVYRGAIMGIKDDLIQSEDE